MKDQWLSKECAALEVKIWNMFSLSGFATDDQLQYWLMDH
jgi:hypothetical protein